MTPVLESIANYVGTNLLSFQNPRVVCPPGLPETAGRRNIVVATPMRSGTHVLIDAILNNLPEFRRRPLYVDLDQCLRSARTQAAFLARLEPDSGYVIKTHLPTRVAPANQRAPAVRTLLREAVVVTVRRDPQAVLASMNRWTPFADAAARAAAEQEIAAFWAYWQEFDTVEVAFEALFDPSRCAALLAHLRAMTGCAAPRSAFVEPPAVTERNRIYVDKALTRLLGRHAPRINTTIFTLRG